MPDTGLHVLIAPSDNPSGEEIASLREALTEDGHHILVGPDPAPRAGARTVNHPVGARGTREARRLMSLLSLARRSRTDVVILPDPDPLAAHALRGLRIPVVTAESRTTPSSVCARVRAAANLAERRPRHDARPVLIAVPTYRRNHELEQLLPHLVDQLDGARDLMTDARILVSDNDPAGGAESVVRDFPATGGVCVDYQRVATPGVAANRNACLAAARDGELVVFIDDDQRPRPDWLRRLLAAWQRTGAEAVAGPTRPTYPHRAAPWIEAGPFHDASYLRRDERMTLSAVTNFLVDIDAVRRLGLEFPQMGTRGGEDSWFSAEFVRRGATIVWEPEAVVDEAVPPTRTTPRWVLTRSLGNGVIAARQGVRAHGSPRIGNRLRWTAGGLVRAAGGGVRVAVGAARRHPATLGGGLHTTMRGAGMTLGAWDVVFDEYARDGAPRWSLDRGVTA